MRVLPMRGQTPKRRKGEKRRTAEQADSLVAVATFGTEFRAPLILSLHNFKYSTYRRCGMTGHTSTRRDLCAYSCANLFAPPGAVTAHTPGACRWRYATRPDALARGPSAALRNSAPSDPSRDRSPSRETAARGTAANTCTPTTPNPSKVGPHARRRES
jgi:hypothetical protein